jgi:hypothetical protein
MKKIEIHVFELFLYNKDDILDLHNTSPLSF